MLRKAARAVGRLKGGTVELSEHQRELLKGNDRLFSSKDLVRYSQTQSMYMMC